MRMKILLLLTVVVLLAVSVILYRSYRQRSESEQPTTDDKSAAEFRDANKTLDKVLKLPRGM